MQPRAVMLLVTPITVLLGLCLPVVSGAGAAPSPTDANPVHIEQVFETLFNVYTKMLGRKDWVAQSMGIVCLSRIDDPRVTEKLFKMIGSDASGVVRVYAWEALNARHAALTKDQQQKWCSAGLKLYAQNLLGGDLRASLLRAVAPLGPTPDNLRLYVHLVDNTNCGLPGDSETIRALGEVLALWKTPELVELLIKRYTDSDSCVRSTYILAIAFGKAFQSTLKDMRMRGQAASLQEEQNALMQWAKKAGFIAMKPGDPVLFESKSTMLDPPRKITDASDPYWRKDLELSYLHLNQLDVAFAMDCTGSMQEAVSWIQSEVPRLMSAFGMISREPRIGVVFYRDFPQSGVPAAQDENFVVKNFPLTNDGVKLVQNMAKIRAQAGGDLPEAVYEGLIEALVKQKWSPGAGARRVTILVGDAPPHQETLEDIRKLVTLAADRGIQTHCLKVRTSTGATDLPAFDQIAAWGKGQSIWAQGFTSHSGRQVFAAIMCEIINKDYHDRVFAFGSVLLEYCFRSIPEKNPPIPRGGPSHESVDPQTMKPVTRPASP